MEKLHEETMQLLKKLDLSEKQAQVYLCLLELKETIAASLARRTKLKRPTVYKTLEELLEKGLISQSKKGHALFFRATTPEFFTLRAEDDLRERAKTIHDLRKNLHKIATIHVDTNIVPQMTIYHGTEGLIQIMEDSLTTKDEIWCWSNVSLAVKQKLHKYHPTYLKRKIERKIHSKCIFIDDAEARKFQTNSKKELRHVILIPKEEYPFDFDNEINIYDDKVSIISLKDEIGVIIQNQSIANSQKSIFKIVFDLKNNGHS